MTGSSNTKRHLLHTLLRPVVAVAFDTSFIVGFLQLGHESAVNRIQFLEFNKDSQERAESM
ncbi:MAG: hypothetical protein DMG90_21040 [Acidobacteria bacterium]|nr:MAG: hypothetical protein DMG90_21040 [Acidobacteriota bacterium]